MLFRTWCAALFCTAAYASDLVVPPDLIVAADGSGNFKSVHEAVQSISGTNRERIIILIKNGTYHEKVRVDAPFVTLRGESRKGTRIEFPQLNDDFTRSPDQIGRAVINLSELAGDFVLDNLTVENTAGQIGPHAFTIYGKADKTVIVDCDVLSHGADTVSLWRGDSGRYYHTRCNFRGSVDFVCPRGWCYISDSTFYELKATAAVWHDGAVDRDMKFVLRNCSFAGTNRWNLARHHHDAQFYFIDCRFSATMNDRAPFRVIYPLNGSTPSEADLKKNRELDASNVWGERTYFWNCQREGGDYAWMSNNLSSAVGAPTADQITAAWTFADQWNPEAVTGPRIENVQVLPEVVLVTFNESVTVRGKPRVRLVEGRTAEYASGSGSWVLVFKSAGPMISKATSLDLNGGAIIGSEATATIRKADLKFVAK